MTKTSTSLHYLGWLVESKRLLLLIEANAEVKEHLRHFRHSHDTFATLEPTNIFSPNCVLNFGVLTQMAWLGIFFIYNGS